MKSFILGTTSSGLHIPAYKLGQSGRPSVLVLGGVHGDEREGVEACLGLAHRWSKSFPFRLDLTLIPVLNVDGVLRGNRVNARGVDLNRNLQTNDWSPVVETPRYNPGPYPASEPETQALMEWIEHHKPIFVLSLHSWHPLLNLNGDCRPEAMAMARHTGYKMEETIGYPTPGCLGTYCGLEREMPTLTYEIERGLETKEILKLHLPAIEEGLKVTESRRQKTL